MSCAQTNEISGVFRTPSLPSLLSTSHSLHSFVKTRTQSHSLKLAFCLLSQTSLPLLLLGRTVRSRRGAHANDSYESYLLSCRRFLCLYSIVHSSDSAALNFDPLVTPLVAERSRCCAWISSCVE
ncbi:hypothetical protein PFISCL1PPCAC_9181 [Pristionchus fissidentatus]|uniref:G protein-coupled receptor n=1 Tax=Pristionchus fissidentatus TaxID=1538716 RepID=A0AAV5VEL3_9BILA|nr:hypothetical protein PFISCL1PPCAC_9181 [Pristionchus fissidentatus]